MTNITRNDLESYTQSQLHNYINDLNCDESERISKIALIIAAQTHSDSEDVDRYYDPFQAMYGDEFMMSCVKSAIEIHELYKQR